MVGVVGRDARWDTGIECFRSSCQEYLEAYVMLSDTGRPAYKFLCPGCKKEGSWMEVVGGHDKFASGDYYNKRRYRR